MKKCTLLIVSVLIVGSAIGAISENLTGKWFGTRFQYDETKSKYIAEFEYTYDLKQDGSKISGVSTITSQSGKSAQIALRGFVENNKFYFEEYEVIQATRDENMLWCLKKGVLDIKKEGSETVITGKTPSFMELYGLECTGGLTYLSKEKTTPNDAVVTNIAKEDALESSYNINTYPNPFISDATISFTLNQKNNVTIDIVDIVDIAGKGVKTLTNKDYEAGTHFVTFTPESSLNLTYYIVKLKIGNKVYTRPIQKFENR